MPKSAVINDLKALAAEVKSLKRRVAKLETRQTVKKNNSGVSWRTVAIVVLTGLSGAILISANLLFWTGRTLVENDLYKNTTKAIIEKPAVQQAIAKHTGDAIFQKVNLEQLLTDALPPRADFAVPAIASQIKTTTGSKLQDIVASSKFKETWVDVNTRAHDRFVEFVRNYEGDGTINISDIYAKLVERLQGTKLAFVSNVSLPQKIGSIQVVDAQWLPTAHYVVKYLDVFRIATIVVFILLSILIVFISKNRHKVARRMGVFYALLMLATLVAVRIAREVTISSIDKQWQTAATETWQAFFEPFVWQTSALLLLSLVLALIAWVTGSGKRAKRVQQAANDLFNGKIHKAFFKKENTFTKWVGKYRVQLMWTTVILAFVLLLVISVSVANILWLLFALVLVLVAVQAIAAK